MTTALAVFHQRYSTNTFPNWQLGASVPGVGPQRRNQHTVRKQNLDSRPRAGVGVAGLG